MVLRLLETPQSLQNTGKVDKVELCLKILSTNCLCSPSLTLIFSYIERPAKKSTQYKVINIIIIILF